MSNDTVKNEKIDMIGPDINTNKMEITKCCLENYLVCIYFISYSG